MKLSWEYTVENQFIEITDKWDDNGTYFYYHLIPAGISQVTILNENEGRFRFRTFWRAASSFTRLDGGIYHRIWFTANQYHEEPILLRVFA
jgi:hypothetical protein